MFVWQLATITIELFLYNLDDCSLSIEEFCETGSQEYDDIFAGNVLVNKKFFDSDEFNDIELDDIEEKILFDSTSLICTWSFWKSNSFWIAK